MLGDLATGETEVIGVVEGAMSKEGSLWWQCAMSVI